MSLPSSSMLRSMAGDTHILTPVSRPRSPSPTGIQRRANGVRSSMRRTRNEPLLHNDNRAVDLRTEYSTRCMYSQPGRAKRPRLQQTLFEVLPVDVCSRIAAYVSYGKPSQDALHLAETSPHLRNAVVSTLSYKYVCVDSWYYSQDVVKRWAVVFSNDLQDLTILQPRCSDKDAYELMLNSTSLQTVELQDTTYAMHQHLALKEIRNLTIILTGVSPHLWFSSTPSPTVRDLTLSCMNSKNGDSANMRCAIDMVCERDGGRLINAAFPNLQAIEVRCRCSCVNTLHWELVRCLPMLEEIRMDDLLIPEDMHPRVRKLKSVKISNLGTVVVFAHAIGVPLTSLQTEEVVDEEDLRYEEIWSGLTSITIALVTGAEAAFLAAVPLFSETLRTLRLSRSTDDVDHLEIREDFGLPCTEPEGGVWLELVKGLPHVQRLGFKNIRVDLDELIAIIKHVGERLQSLEITLGMQQEHSLTRLERVLLAASVHCPSLRNLDVEISDLHGPDLTTELFFPCRVRWMAHMGRKVGRALELMRRRSPFFDDAPLKLFVRKLINL